MTLAELRFIDGDQRSIELFPGPLVIGRDPSCDRVIQHEKVSKRHVEIWRDQDHRWYVRDLGSSNGTQVERKRITEPTRLVSGMTLHIGAVGLSFFVPEEAAPARAGSVPTAPRSARARAGDAARLAATGGTGGAARTPFRPRNDLVRLAWGTVVVLICVYAGLQVWQRVGSESQTATTDEPRIHETVGDRAPPPSTVGPRAVGTDDPDRATVNLDAVNLDAASVDAATRAGVQGDGQAPNAIDPATVGIVDPSIDRESPTPGAAGSDTSTTDEPVISQPPPVEPETVEPETVEPETVEPGTPVVTDPPADPPTGAPPTDAHPTEAPSAGAGATAEVQPAIDPIIAALESGDFGVLARHLLSKPESEHRARIHAFLTSAPIVCLTRNGLLGAAGETRLAPLLARSYRRCCSPDDARAMVQLPFGCQIVHRELRVRFEHDYHSGLGRLVGKSRLAPHPKQVTIELRSVGDKEKVLGQVDGKTPWIAPDKIPTDGMSEEEVWQITVEPLIAELERALTEDARKVSP